MARQTRGRRKLKVAAVVAAVFLAGAFRISAADRQQAIARQAAPTGG